MSSKLYKSSISCGTYVLISDFANDMHVVSRVPDEPALDKGDVQNRGVEIDELENEDFEGQIVVEFRLGAMHFWKLKTYPMIFGQA